MCLALSVIDGLKHVQLEPDYGRLDNSNLVNKPRMIFMLLTLHRAILDSQAFSLPTLAGEMSSRLRLLDANLQMHRPTLPPKGSAI